VSVLHQLSCKFYAGVHYTAFTSSTSPRHLLFAFCDICNILGTAQQQALPKGILFICQSAGHFTTPLKTAYEQQASQVTAALARYTSAALHNGVAKNYSFLDYFSAHGLQNTILTCGSYVAELTVYIGLFLPGLFDPNDRITAILRKASHF